jgi:hypothetical protein
MVTYTDGCPPGFVFRAADYYTASDGHEGCVLNGTIGERSASVAGLVRRLSNPAFDDERG